jgi:hypothetical protein
MMVSTFTERQSLSAHQVAEPQGMPLKSWSFLSSKPMQTKSFGTRAKKPLANAVGLSAVVMIARRRSIRCEISPPIRTSPTKPRLRICLPRNAPCAIAASNCWRFIIHIQDHSTRNHLKLTCDLPTIHRRFTLLSDWPVKSLACAPFTSLTVKDAGNRSSTKSSPTITETEIKRLS